MAVIHSQRNEGTWAQAARSGAEGSAAEVYLNDVLIPPMAR